MNFFIKKHGKLELTAPIKNFEEDFFTPNPNGFEHFGISSNEYHEISFDTDKKLIQKINSEIFSKNEDKLLIETSCVCDGTLAFGVHLVEKLESIGATDIKLRSEEVDNPDPEWMKTRFIASGFICNIDDFVDLINKKEIKTNESN